MTLKDIAKEAGVSTATVSNVINGNHHKVSKETIDKIQKIISENDYTPSATARSLIKKESKIIGVVVPNLSEKDPFSSSPYNTQILSWLENYIRNQGYYMMIRTVGRCQDILQAFLTWNIDGLILLGAFKEEAEEIRDLVKIPTVFLDTYADGIANVGIDDYMGGYLAAKYLLNKGHRDIAFAGPVTTEGVIAARFKGFEDALKEKGLSFNSNRYVEAMTYFEDVVKAGKRLAFLQEKCTACVCMSDILAFGIMEGLRLSGLRVPEDISVVGFDNLPECKYSNPQLTTVSQNIKKKAVMAGNILFEMIKTKKNITCNHQVTVEIEERFSVKQL